MSLSDIKMLQHQTEAFRIACFIDAQLTKGTIISLLIGGESVFCYKQIYIAMKSCKGKLSDPAVFNENLFLSFKENYC